MGFATERLELNGWASGDGNIINFIGNFCSVPSDLKNSDLLEDASFFASAKALTDNYSY
jgi:hypothetical protein